MANVFNRGTKDRPRWYVQVKERDGKWRMRPALDARGLPVATKRDAQRAADEMQARIDAGRPDPRKAPTFADLAPEWLASLTNRNAYDDRLHVNRDVLPKWRDVRVNEIDIIAVQRWVSELRAKGQQRAETAAVDGKRHAPYSAATQRKTLNLLSRFFSWAIGCGYAQINPVRNLPHRSRPKGKRRADTPWIADDDIVRRAMAVLPFPLGPMFYLANRAGLRPGELWGLRVSDVGFLDEGTIRVRFSYDGPLKEDKDATGDKVKFVPAPDDATAVLGPILVRRRAEGAGPEDVLFPRKLEREAPPKAPKPPGPKGRDRLPESMREQKRLVKLVDREWAAVREGLGLGKMTWYQATRHSSVSRNLAAGASLDEVSAAVGHHSPLVTKAHYDHFVRRTFSSTLRRGLGIKPTDADAKVIAFPTAKTETPPPDAAGEAFTAAFTATAGQNLVTTGDPTGN